MRLFIDEEGIVDSHNAAPGWVKASISEPALEKTFNLNVLFSGIESTDIDVKEVKSVEIYNLNGMRIKEAPHNMPVIIKTIFIDGSCSVSKVIVAD